jgi:protein-tyrosine phosphatase
LHGGREKNIHAPFPDAGQDERARLPINGSHRVTRLIGLEGGRNFRDLGGYPTHDGRRTRWGRLYRSGVLAYLTDGDLTHLDALGIRVVCDFRNAHERQREAVRWARNDLEHLSWDYDPSLVSLRGILGSEELTPASARSAMIRLYRALPVHFEEPYAGLFARLAAGDLPLVFACAAGKDRTGLAAALVLTSLGVPREFVLEDFRLTDRTVDLERVLAHRPDRSIGLDADRVDLIALPREARAPLLSADSAYLEAAFDAIESAHGSINAYLHDRLDVSDQSLAHIREYLLED